MRRRRLPGGDGGVVTAAPRRPSTNSKGLVMSKTPELDFDPAYRGGGQFNHAGKPPWRLGEPQPEISAPIEQGRFYGEGLDAGFGEAAPFMRLADAGYTRPGQGPFTHCL